MAFRGKMKFKTRAEKKTKTGQDLKNYGYWLLSKRDYGYAELVSKLNNYALNEQESEQIAAEFAELGYINDQRVSQQVVRSQLMQGSGLRKIQQTFQKKGLDLELVQQELQEVDWLSEAYALKVRRFGEAVEKDQKLLARQIGFLQRKGFDLGVVLKVVKAESGEFD